jgi:ubiquinone/menaquinone biosynthesis C-methylase UbiE
LAVDAPRPSWYGRLVERTADVALTGVPVPRRILDVACGDGTLVREMVARVPYAEAVVGVDSSPATLVELRRDADARLTFVLATADSLPFEDASFDLVLAVGTFDSWPDREAALAELARVVHPGGRVVVVDRAGTRLRKSGRARSVRRVRSLFERAGLDLQARETLARRALVLPRVRAFVGSP